MYYYNFCRFVSLFCCCFVVDARIIAGNLHSLFNLCMQLTIIQTQANNRARTMTFQRTRVPLVRTCNLFRIPCGWRYAHRDVWSKLYHSLQAYRYVILYMAGCKTAREIRWSLNHIHSIKYVEVISASSVANWMWIDYSLLEPLHQTLCRTEYFLMRKSTCPTCVRWCKLH